jgi:hypothetical protein
MLNDEIVAMSLVEYVNFLIETAEFIGHNHPHKVNWEYCHWQKVVSFKRYSDAIPLLAERGYESWMEDDVEERERYLLERRLDEQDEQDRVDGELEFRGGQ